MQNHLNDLSPEAPGMAPVPPDEPRLPLSAIQAQIGFLEGDILTIFEATLQGTERNMKATRDLIRNAFRSRQRWVDEIAGGGLTGVGMAQRK